MLKNIRRTLGVLGAVCTSFLLNPSAFAQTEFTQVDHSGAIVCGLKDDNAIACNSAVVISARTPDDFPPVESMSVGRSAVCTVLVGGELRCFGTTAFGLQEPPSQGAPYKAVAVGASHACAINNGGGIECWGDPDTNDRLALLNAPAGEFTQVSLSRQQACALDINGGVSCWGANDQGTSSVPADLPPATKVVAGFASSCALLTDGSIQCWGREIPSLAGPFVDFDLYAENSLERGETGLCALNEQGTSYCDNYSYDGDFVYPQDDLEQPGGTGIRTVTLFGQGKGCFVNSIGEIDCFGQGSGTEPPTLEDDNMVPTTTGLRAQVYSATNVELFWDSPSRAFDVAGHEISRNDEIVVQTQNASSYIFGDLVEGVTETFAVRQVHINGDTGEFSAPISVTTQAGDPDLPPGHNPYTPPDRLFEPNYADAFVFCEDAIAEVFWFSDNPSPDIDGYEIRRDGEFIAFTQNDHIDDRGIRPGVIHNYDVIAIDLDDPTRFHGVASAVLEFVNDEEICGE